MSDDTITRRRIVQGIGTVGLTGLVAGPVSAQTENETTADETPADEQTTAIRVAHAVADAPAVDVRLTSGGGMSGDTDSTAADGGTATEGNVTDGTTTDGDSDVSIAGLGFGAVTDYQELDPGTYRLEIAATDGGLLEQIADLFGGGDEDGTVIFQESVEIEAGTTYTAVAFGELAEGPAGGGTGGDEDTSDDGEDEETETDDSDAADTESLAITAGQGLQVDVLQDDLSAPDDQMARVRVFHSVPDAESVSIVTTDPAGGDGAMTETDGDVTETDGDDTAAGDQSQAGSRTTLVEDLRFGESQTLDLEAGSYTLEIAQRDGTGDAGEPTTDEQATDEQMDETETSPVGDEVTTRTGDETGPQTVDLSVDAGSVYSGFAIGYFDPAAAAEQGSSDGTGDGPVDETNETGNGNESAGQGTDSDRAGRVRSRNFELVTVKDSQDGERVAGGNRGLL